MGASEMGAVERVVEFVSAATLPAHAADVVAPCHYHDGMGHGVAVLSGADLRAVLVELERARATIKMLRELAAENHSYIRMQRDLLRRNGDVIDNLREQIPEQTAQRAGTSARRMTAGHGPAPTGRQSDRGRVSPTTDRVIEET